jgi:hypothetical protein
MARLVARVAVDIYDQADSNGARRAAAMRVAAEELACTRPAGWQSWTTPFAIDGIAVIGMVMRSKAFSRSTRRLGFRVQITAGLLSLACNVFAGDTIGERVYGAMIVALFIFSEWLSDRMESHEVDEEPARVAKRAAAITKGKATRAANKEAAERLAKSGRRRMNRERAKITG